MAHADQFKNKGFLKKYKISKADGSALDPNAEYFVLRLDDAGKDPKHVHACRMAILEYANLISDHLPLLSDDIKKKYGKYSTSKSK